MAEGATAPFNFVEKVEEFNKKIEDMIPDIKTLTTLLIEETRTNLGGTTIYDTLIKEFTDCSDIISNIKEKKNKTDETKQEHFKYFEDLYNKNFGLGGFTYKIKLMKDYYENYHKFFSQRGQEFSKKDYDEIVKVKEFYEFRNEIANNFIALQKERSQIMERARNLMSPSGGSRKSRKSYKKASKKTSKKQSKKASRKPKRKSRKSKK